MATEFENKDNSSELANSLFTSLTAGITIPAVPSFEEDKYNIDPDTTSDLYKDISGVSLNDVTTNSLEGTGAFDVMMSAMDKHLQREFKGDRITGSQYAEVYTAVANQVLGQATTFALQKDQARWQAITAQMQARITQIQATQALIELEKTKVETTKAVFDMQLAGAQYGLTKMQIATEEANHDSVTADVALKHFQRNYQAPAELAVTQYERTAVMPSTVAMNQVQVDRILPAQAALSEYQNRILQPLEADLQKLQRDRIIPVQADMAEFQRDKLQPVELAQQQFILQKRQPSEVKLIDEQFEAQRAQTLDLRSDGLTPVSGVLGIQKRQGEAQIDLTEEQVETQRANTLDTRTDGTTAIAGTVGLQKRNLTVDADTKDYVLANQLPRQVALIEEQITMTNEQGEAERAKTLDTRSDGATVVGSVGKQKDLYDQQITSFIRDAEHKTAKMYLDGWITQKTLDEGLTAPSELTNTNVSAVLSGVRTNNNL